MMRALCVGMSEVKWECRQSVPGSEHRKCQDPGTRESIVHSRR